MRNSSLILLLVLLLATACAPQPRDDIIVTIYPLLDITQEIAGQDVSVASLIPPGVELHQYEPAASDMVRLGQAKMFVRIGLEWDSLEDRFIDALSEKPFIISASQSVDLVRPDDDTARAEEGQSDDVHEEEHEHSHEEHDDVHEEHEHSHEEEHEDNHDAHAHEEEHEDNHDAHAHEEEHEHSHEEHDHSHGIDPHIWLSPKPMKIVARNIADGMKQADPANTERYEANVQVVLAKLDALDAEYTAGLSSCTVSTIIVSHLAFGYPARDYGFGQLGIHGLAPQSEPSPRTLKQLIDVARSQNVKHILYEELVDPRVSKTIANEVGATPLVISHIDVRKPGKDYYAQMRDNLQILRTALQCD